MKIPVFLVLFLLGFGLSGPPAEARTDVLFSPNGGVKERLTSELAATTKSIDIAMYSFSDQDLLGEVGNLAKAGIQVRLILNDARKQKLAAESLEALGVDVRYVTPVMHHKFAIIDGPITQSAAAATATLLTGSGNWSTSSSSRYDDDFLVFNDEATLVLAFQAEFNHLWQNAREFGVSRNKTSITIDAPAAPVVFTSSNMEAYKRGGEPTFRPIVEAKDGIAGRTLVKAIADAKSSVKIATAHFRREDIYQALQAALARGVSVEVLLDGQEYHGKIASRAKQDIFFDEMLAVDGADVRYKAYSRVWNYMTTKQMHVKYMIVDDETVLTGSYNWSYNSELRSFENLMTLMPGMAADYLKNFETIFHYGAGRLPELLDEVKKAAGQGPCDFAPIALSGKDVASLHAAYRRGACRH